MKVVKVVLCLPMGLVLLVAMDRLLGLMSVHLLHLRREMTSSFTHSALESEAEQRDVDNPSEQPRAPLPLSNLRVVVVWCLSQCVWVTLYKPRK